MGNRGISKPKHNHEEIDNLNPATGLRGSTDQPDSAGDQEDEYVSVTILAKKVGVENATIQLKQLLVSFSICFSYSYVYYIIIS